jgi:tripartite-type tricarboxylate transporter receptor subunit TctC
MIKKLLVGAMMATAALGAAAQDWPSAKPIKIIAVFPPGGSVDQVSRILAEALRTELNQTVVVENIGGASGAIGTAAVAKADPDGYTFGVVFDTHGVNQALQPRLAYDTMKDLTHINLIGTSPMLLASTKGSPIKSFKQLIDESKAKKPTSFGTIGAGSLGPLAMAQLAQRSGFDWNHVPYRGGGPLMNDAIGGHVPLAIGSLFLVKPHADAGNVTPLGVTTSKRHPAMPNVPTIAESGFPGFDAPAFWGVIGPAKIPDAIVNRMNAAVSNVLKKPDVAKKLEDQGIEILAQGPVQFTSFVQRQMDTWGKFIKDNNITQ